MERVDVSQSSARILVLGGHKAEVSQASARMMARLPMETFVSQASARALIGYIPLQLQEFRISQGKARMLLRVSPNFRWVDMFTDIVFPNDISENSDSSTRFNTLVNQVSSGHDQRIALWDHPLMEYNVTYGVRTMEQLHAMIRLFRAVRGRLNSFRFLDKIDFTSTFAVRDEARAAEDISPLDQQIGVGDDETLSFQLVKHYPFDDEVTTRPIYKPIEGTVSCAINDVEITNFEVDHSTGILTIVPRVDVALPEATLANVAGITWRITVADTPETHLPLLEDGDFIDVVGFPEEVIRGVVVGSTTTALDFAWAAGTVGGPFVDVAVQLTTDDTPQEGDVITAGFMFHVPVRFDSDRIPVRLEYYGVGSASEVRLVEVRPDQE